MNDTINFSPSALAHLQQSMQQAPDGSLGIRIGLRDAGCSGYAYTVDYAKQQNSDDQVFNFDQLSIFIAQEFMSALGGMQIDYVTRGMNSILEFNNPNVVDQCGCGESFKFKAKPEQD